MELVSLVTHGTLLNESTINQFKTSQRQRSWPAGKLPKGQVTVETAQTVMQYEILLLEQCELDLIVREPSMQYSCKRSVCSLST
jgi:hypothetical protein